MSKHCCVLVGLVLAVLAVPLSAGELTEEQARAEAHRTIFRRLGQKGGAATAKLGLPESAREMVDLYLDLQRNKQEIRARRAPRSQAFYGTPHFQMSVEDGSLNASACFAKLIIDETRVPLAGIQQTLTRTLDPVGFRKAATSWDGDAFDGWRLSLCAELILLCDEHLSAEDGWVGMRGKALDELLAAAGQTPGLRNQAALMCLSKFGDEELCKRLIGKAEALAGKLETYELAGYVRAICAMNNKTAKAYAMAILDGDDPNRACTALGVVGRDPDEAIWKYMEKVLTPDSEAPQNLRDTAQRSLESLKSERAQKVVIGVFENPKNDREKYAAAATLARMGSKYALPYLKAKKKEFEQDPNKGLQLSILKKLLESLGE